MNLSHCLFDGLSPDFLWLFLALRKLIISRNETTNASMQFDYSQFHGIL